MEKGIILFDGKVKLYENGIELNLKRFDERGLGPNWAWESYPTEQEFVRYTDIYAIHPVATRVYLVKFRTLGIITKDKKMGSIKINKKNEEAIEILKRKLANNWESIYRENEVFKSLEQIHEKLIFYSKTII